MTPYERAVLAGAKYIMQAGPEGYSVKTMIHEAGKVAGSGSVYWQLQEEGTYRDQFIKDVAERVEEMYQVACEVRAHCQ